MDIPRLTRHLMAGTWQTRRAFSTQVLRVIERAIGQTEQMHAGEIRFAVEGSLPLSQLLAGHTARARAVEVFSQLRIWDTAHNNGVLVYVLLADRAVEIVADRGIDALVDQRDWDTICNAMQAAYGRGEFEQGSVAGVQAIAQHLALHFPPTESASNELPDVPVML